MIYKSPVEYASYKIRESELLRLEIPSIEESSPSAEERPPLEVSTPMRPGNQKRKLVIVGIVIVLVSVAALYVFTGQKLGTGGGTSFSDAILITGTVSANIARDQEVYYKFWVGDGQRAIVTLDPPPSYADFFLYDSRATSVNNKNEASEFQIDYNYSLSGYEQLNAVVTGSSGYYYVYIGDSREGSYTISVSLVPTPSSALQGGSFADAIALSGSVYENAVKDQSVYYKFWVNEGENFSFDASTSSYDSFIIVYNPNQTQKRSFKSGGGGFQNVESSGYYYIEIWNREDGWYSLSASTS